MSESRPDHPTERRAHRARARPRGTLSALLHRGHDAFERIASQLFVANAWVYAAAGTVIGLEGVALWLSFLAVWPVGVPLVLAGIAVAGVVVRSARATRSHESSRFRGDDGNRTRTISLED